MFFALFLLHILKQKKVVSGYLFPISPNALLRVIIWSTLTKWQWMPWG